MKERVSALLDGALDDDASARVFESIKRDAGLREDWERYCLIGDVLRDESSLSAGFTDKVMASLDGEPTVLAPVRRERSAWAVRLMPIAASVMGVAAVGWVALTLNGPGPEVQRLASAKPAAVVAAPVERVALAPAEASEREYLFAHQAMAPAAGMPGVAHYVRTVSDTRVAGER